MFLWLMLGMAVGTAVRTFAGTVAQFVASDFPESKQAVAHSIIIGGRYTGSLCSAMCMVALIRLDANSVRLGCLTNAAIITSSLSGYFYLKQIQGATLVKVMPT